MTWLGVPLSADQSDLVGMLDALAAKQDADAPGDAYTRVAGIRAALVEAGVWTLGVPEEIGGGGAPADLRQLALACLGRRWAGAAWGSVQAHAAAEVLGSAGLLDVVAEIHAGHPVVVVELDSAAVELEASDDAVRGRLWRIDPAGEHPHVVVLVDDRTAWYVRADSVQPLRTLRRTGMAGALTLSADVDAHRADVAELTDLPLDGIRARLHLGAAAVAAGLAAEAAERAIEYSQARVQFGGPLTRLATVRSALFRQTQLALESFSIAVDGTTTAVAAAAALAGNCERAIAVGAAALQSHGGYGYIVEYGVEGLLRDAVSLRAATGALAATQAAAALLVGGSAQLLAEEAS
ncbi:acyl-CoA dehydrogenase [Nocardioides marmoriginsengisoli]|uniref:Acyl-CoA dehydrogenase n=1 Tax=Nocardioides marmoriginsengisoli TaxID=661483 RepID=A0A3N0CH87_9ACTN|nr:acyl-CoA dehydrogenase family protein [Nocardioides marmoriginsengisoli]RNL62815.1 acyl-CoA dehydrogenase [Nocardioides marmoriginsengisoli]